MQFCKKLSITIMPNRALLRRVVVVDEGPKFTLPSVIRNLSDGSSNSDKVVSALPPKPKRPMGVFLRFMKLVEPNVIQNHPSAKRKDMYKNIDEKLKLTLQEEYLKEKERYIQERESYSSELSEEQKQTLYEAQLDKKKQKTRKELKKKADEFKKPKRPPNAYLLFVQSKKSREMFSGNLTEWAKKIGNEWNNLSPEEKNVYKEKANKLLHEYRNDLCKWESEMDDLGHSDLLRKVKKSRNTSNSQSESMAVAANLSDYVENVIHRYSEIDKDKKKTITSNEREHIILSSPSHKCDSKGSSSISYSKLESTENNYSFDENSSKLRKVFLSKLVFFLNSYLSDKRTVHIMMGVTFSLIFFVWPLLYWIR